MLPAVYLAGAIRDGEEGDIVWREWTIEMLKHTARLLNPLGGKQYRDGSWSLHGYKPRGSVIVPHDFWMVDQCQVLVANFLAMAERYPCIGTLIEWGRATRRDVLRYAIWSPSIPLHPFVGENAALVFSSVEACIDFLRRHLPVLAGVQPAFGAHP